MRSRAVQGAGLVLVLALVAIVVTQIAFALPTRTMPSPSPTPDWSDVRPGSDASWPSCTPPRGTKRTLPLAEDPAFVVVGVNDGLPGTRSACIARELAWADTATGGTRQPRFEYYVMAADPWTKPELRWVPRPEWPSANRVDGVQVVVPGAFASTAHGTACAGGRTERACAYVYGWTMAQRDAALPGLRAPGSTRFWIDVEAVRTWNRDRRFNQAVVEGMVAGFTAPRSKGGVGTTVGLYSTSGEWARIMGRLRRDSPLVGLDQWLAIGPATKAEAVALLRRGWGFQPGGALRMVQYRRGPIDWNVAVPLP